MLRVQRSMGQGRYAVFPTSKARCKMYAFFLLTLSSFITRFPGSSPIPNPDMIIPQHLRIFLRLRPLEVPDLLDQVVLLVAELFVLGAVCLEVAQELHQLGLVLQQDVQNWLCLAGVGHEHLNAEAGLMT